MFVLFMTLYWIYDFSHFCRYFLNFPILKSAKLLKIFFVVCFLSSVGQLLFFIIKTQDILRIFPASIEFALLFTATFIIIDALFRFFVFKRRARMQ